mmetsp:Transcript_23261/g.64973  ORF Transcript_23261/g.64973 Transcript_23261/m.64973 type:complete len:267 (-) Transcript_23261:1030-1830(-)
MARCQRHQQQENAHVCGSYCLQWFVHHVAAISPRSSCILGLTHRRMRTSAREGSRHEACLREFREGHVPSFGRLCRRIRCCRGHPVSGLYVPRDALQVGGLTTVVMTTVTIALPSHIHGLHVGATHWRCERVRHLPHVVPRRRNGVGLLHGVGERRELVVAILVGCWAFPRWRRDAHHPGRGRARASLSAEIPGRHLRPHHAHVVVGLGRTPLILRRGAVQWHRGGLVQQRERHESIREHAALHRDRCVTDALVEHTLLRTAEDAV